MPNEQRFLPSEMSAPKEYSAVDQAIFQKDIEPDYQPAVLRGFAASWPIVEQSNESPTGLIEELKSKSKSQKVKLISLPANGRMFYNESLTGMDFSVASLPVVQAIDAMAEYNPQSQQCVQCIDVASNFPSLMDNCTNPIVPTIQPQIWIGNKVRVAPHFDEASNIAVVVSGKRRFTLFPPQQTENLYVGPLDYTPAGQPISLVDINAPDLSRFPKYKTAFEHGLSVVLEPGDAIYIPTPWWHAVESLSEFNVLVNYWWSQRTLSSMLPFPMLMHVLQSLNSMQSKEREAWVAMLEHFMHATDNDSEGLSHIPEDQRRILSSPDARSLQIIHQWLGAKFR